MAMQAALKVDPQVVLSKSSDMKTIRANLSNTMQQIVDKVHSLSSTWDSDASTAYRAQFDKTQNDINEMLHIVDQYTYDLDEIAQNYISTEQKVAAASSALPSDVFGV